MEKCKFTFDESPVFDGFAHGSHWNGFDNVAVTGAERARIAAWMESASHDPVAAREEVADLLAIDPIDPLSGLYSLGWGYATSIVREPAPLPACAEYIIALRFVEVLQAWLSPQEWTEMRERNAKQTNTGICHSHDFCDSNMAMAEAFESVTGREPDTGSDADTALWNAAWALAMPILGRKA
jgi:hypothetical protein